VVWRNEPANKIVAPEEDSFALNRTLFYAAIQVEFKEEFQIGNLRFERGKRQRQRPRASAGVGMISCE
jgi:hypothetical protein